MDNEILFNILRIAVVVIGILITRFLIPWIKSKTEGTNRDQTVSVFLLLQEEFSAAILCGSAGHMLKLIYPAKESNIIYVISERFSVGRRYSCQSV